MKNYKNLFIFTIFFFNFNSWKGENLYPKHFCYKCKEVPMKLQGSWPNDKLLTTSL